MRGNLTGRTEFISPATSADLGDFEISADCKMNSSRGQCGFFAGKEVSAWIGEESVHSYFMFACGQLCILSFASLVGFMRTDT